MSDLKDKVLVAEPVPCSARPILYDGTKCTGCNACVNICQVDILIPSPEKGGGSGTNLVIYFLKSERRASLGQYLSPLGTSFF